MRAGVAASAAAFVAAVAFVPLALDDFETLQFAYVGIYVVALAGLNVLTGYTGQISLGHGAFMAVGGYTTAILAAKHGVPYYWTIPVAGVLTGVAGFLGGIPALRLSGLYLALATFGVAVSTPAVIKHFGHLTGGSTGLSFPIVKAPDGTGLSQNRWLYYLAWACALLALAAAWLVVRGRTGLAFRAIRDSEVAAAASGVNLALYKTLAFGISAAFAGVAGSLYAVANLSYVAPETFRVNLSVFLVVGVVFAGLGSLWGLAFGAALIEFLPVKTPEIVNGVNWLLHTSIDPKTAGVSDAIFGGVLVLVMLVFPRGVAGALRVLALQSGRVMRRLSLGVATLVAAVAAAAALAGATADPGVTDTSIVIGGTAPLSGEASSAAAVARGAEAYFAWVNAHGGVAGRQITYKYVDDGYDPSRTVQAVRQLVQQDQVFAIFNTLGTNNNLAARDFLNQAGVPQVFCASGAAVLGSDPKRYPWTIGYIPSYVFEGTVYGRYALRTKPASRIAVLYQDDEYGHELLAGLKRGLGAKQKQLVKAVGYDPTAADVQSEVAQLKASKADTFMIFAFGKFAVQAFVDAAKLGWRPRIFVNAVGSSASLMTLATLTAGKKETTGAISVVFFKDPTDPRWANDPGLALYKTVLKAYDASADPRNGYYGAGMASAYTLVDALKKAGKDLSRASLMKAVLSLNETTNPFVLPGIAIKTSATDRFPMQQVGLQRWAGDHWVEVAG